MSESIFKYPSFGKWIYKQSAYSTNEEIAKSIPRKGINTNILLYTHSQTAGKGQIGKKWYSGSHKNLSFSLMLPIQHLPANRQWFLNMTIALIAKNWIEKWVETEVKIKWPNDIYVGNKKIAGILIVNNIKGSDIMNSVVGIGININEDDFPTDLPNPVSMFQITRKEFSLNDLMADFILHCENEMDRLGKLSFNEIKQLYTASMYLLNYESKFIIDKDEPISAKILGVEESGLLRLLVNGEIRLFNFHELKYADL